MPGSRRSSDTGPRARLSITLRGSGPWPKAPTRVTLSATEVLKLIILLGHNVF